MAARYKFRYQLPLGPAHLSHLPSPTSRTPNQKVAETSNMSAFGTTSIANTGSSAWTVEHVTSALDQCRTALGNLLFKGVPATERKQVTSYWDNLEEACEGGRALNAGAGGSSDTDRAASCHRHISLAAACMGPDGRDAIEKYGQENGLRPLLKEKEVQGRVQAARAAAEEDA